MILHAGYDCLPELKNLIKSAADGGWNDFGHLGNKNPGYLLGQTNIPTLGNQPQLNWTYKQRKKCIRWWQEAHNQDDFTM